MNLPNRRLAKKRIKLVISKQRFTDLHDFLALGNILLARLTNIFLARRETVAQRVFIIFAREGTLEHLSYINLWISLVAETPIWYLKTCRD